MKLDIVPKQTDELVPTPIVHQTAFWGRVSRRLGFATEAFDLALRRPAAATGTAAERGDFLVVRTHLSDDADSAYVPFGPELAPDADDIGTFLERLSRELRPLLGPRCAFIRWDLPWTNVYAREPDRFADDGQWHGTPPTRVREMRMNFATREHNLWKAPRDLLPADTILVDLTQSEDALLARMHPKTRYNIRLAERHGVVVEQGTVADLPAWYRTYCETMARHILEPMPLAHFEALLEERAEGSASPVSTRLLLARHEGTLLAGMLLAIAPSRATYLYGASTREQRELMAPYALQWSAIRLAKQLGALDYDMLGAAPRGDARHHPLAGVHRFKSGFGGALVHREGCWDFPYDETIYASWRGWEQAQMLERAVAPGELR